MLKARVNLLDWFRYKTGLRFWIYSYGLVWDDLLSSVKWKGEVFVQTDDGTFKGFLRSYSIKDETKEIFLDKPKKINGREEDIEGEENAGLLIPGSKIKRIIVPERSFKKHSEPMGHISQALYCQIIAIGLFFLSYSAHLTGNYMTNLKLPSVSLASLEFFYDWLLLIFLFLTIVVLCVSVWVAQKDFDNLRSFLVLSPPIAFVPLFFSLLSVLLIIFDMKIFHALVLIIAFIALFLISPLYIKFLNWIQKPSIKFLRHWMEAFSNLKSFLVSFRYISFAALFLLLVGILLYIFIKQILPVPISMMDPYFSLLSGLLDIDSFKMLWVLIFILVLSLLYITISNWLKKPINDCFDKIKEDFKGNLKLLKDVIQEFYSQLSCNEKEKIENIKKKILKKYENDEEKKKNKIENLIMNLDVLKGYLFSMVLRPEDEDDLNKGIVSEALKEVFKNNNFPLPENSISRAKEDNKWVITDKERKKTYYIVWKEDGKLKIYNKDMEYLENEDFNIIYNLKVILKKVKG